ncbi:death domain-associated protein [Halobacteriales archaeon QS_8_65_32]|nr:MAG: death domain-associated protein [Halobacteriales archaeon QS_8_65_32]
MGFGSYDESEQEDQNVDFNEEDGVETTENDHEGEVNFEFTASNDELLDRLEDIKEE